MKKLLMLFLAILLTTQTNAQIVKELNGKYVISNTLDLGKGTIEMYEYINYDMYLKHMEARQNHTRLSVEDENKAFETQPFKLEKGTYFLNNEEEKQKMWFIIGQQGQFIGTAKAEIQGEERKDNKWVKTTLFYTFRFENGKTAETQIRNTRGKLVKKYEVNDSSLIMKQFDENEKITSTSIVRTDKSFPNSIVINYYPNGNTKSEDDYIAETEKQFHENGNKKLYKNHKTDEEIEYDELGRNLKRFYKTATERCTEYFKDGIITHRNCTSKNYMKNSYFSFKDGGKLDYYIIDEKGERKTYDKNNKLIKTEKSQSAITAP